MTLTTFWCAEAPAARRGSTGHNATRAYEKGANACTTSLFWRSSR